MKKRLLITQNIHQGFTLLELLLAVFIFALISTGAYQVFNIAQKSAGAISNKQERLRDVSLSLEIIEKDFTQLTPRFWRDPFSDALTPSLQTDYSGNYLVSLVRGGWRNPLGNNRSNQQAVVYRIKEDKLLREYMLHLDNISSTEAKKTELLDGVTSINIRYLNRNNGEWSDVWPPSSSENRAQLINEQDEQISIFLPIAIELTLELEDMGEIVSIIPLSPGA